jgi:uncharacterized phiE125 gp8 family phage protein
MHVAVVTPPADFITLAQAKAQLRIEHGEEDGVIAIYVAAAIQHMDGVNGYLRRPVGQQVLAITAYRFPLHRGPGCGMQFPFPTVTAVNDAEIIDADGQLVHVDPDIYELSPEGRLQLAYGKSWPARRDSADPITITVTAGWEVVPKPIVVATLMHINAMYDEGDAAAGFPKAARDLVDGLYRLPRV